MSPKPPFNQLNHSIPSQRKEQGCQISQPQVKCLDPHAGRHYEFHVTSFTRMPFLIIYTQIYLNLI